MPSLAEILAAQAAQKKAPVVQMQTPSVTVGPVESQKQQPTVPVASAAPVAMSGLGALLAANAKPAVAKSISAPLAEIAVDEPDSEVDDEELQEHDALSNLDIALAALNAQTAETGGGIASITAYADHIPATQNLPPKPQREALGTDADSGLTGFVNLIDQVYSIYDDPELLANVIRSIMIELRANPVYMQQVRQDDVHMWVKAMRDNMGLSVVRKEAAKAKKTTTGKTAVAKNQELDAIAASLGMNFDQFNK